MGAEHGIITSEKDQSLTFRQIVLDQQERWRRAKKPPLSQRSQAIDFPDWIANRTFNGVLQKLPDYIPEDLKDHIRSSHPTPIYTTSVMQDQRFSDDKLATDFKQGVPSRLNERDELRWMDGMLALEEIATRGLEADIKGKKPRQDILESLSRITGIHGMERLRQALAISMLSGDREIVNRVLAEYNLDIDRLAFYLGRSSVTLTADGSLRPAREDGTYVAGRVRNEFPGIIELDMAIGMGVPLALSGIGFNSLAMGIKFASQNSPGAAVFSISMFAAIEGVALAVNKLPDTLAHETIHYLAGDINHHGFIQVAYSRKP